MEYFTMALKKMFDFQSRARRKEYWMFILFALIFLVLIFILSDFLPGIFFKILISVYILSLIIPLLSITVRRLHDIGKSGGYIFVRFIPVIGNFWLLSLMIQKGNIGENKYGSDPKNPVTELDDIGKPND